MTCETLGKNVRPESREESKRPVLNQGIVSSSIEHCQLVLNVVISVTDALANARCSIMTKMEGQEYYELTRSFPFNAACI